ncbi:hypothetical protein Acsp02_12850 [Actinoplanes sp. NBRC 103695]|nr:hypothetical protein Acsp02_12850 [Actinoplanes sp. NBRC 103695]
MSTWWDWRRGGTVHLMSGECASRTAWWRRWAGLPAFVALFFATSVVTGTAQTAQASTAVPGPSAVQVVIVPAPHVLGQRPDLPVVGHGGQRRVAPDPAGLAWLPERAGVGTVTWWHLRCDSDVQRKQTGRDARQVRGPPGRRAADALS